MVDIKKQELKRSIELFYFAYRSFTEGPDKILARKKLNRVHHRILYFVGRNPGINVNELLATLKVSKQALNAPLRKLQGQGLVKARVGSHDKRVRQLSLSASGRKLEEELTRTQMKQLESVFRHCDRKAFIHWAAVMEGVAGL